MKANILFIVSILATLLVQGCSRNSAYQYLQMNSDEERAIDSLQTGTIASSLETEAIMSTIYLNRVYPKKYNDAEYFFISLYLQADKRLYYNNALVSIDYNLTLNSKPPIEVKKLKPSDPIRQLMPLKNEWNRYYLVEFEKLACNCTKRLVLSDSNGKKISIIYEPEDLE